MEEILCAGPYFVYVRSLILKKMPRFFTFGATEMVQVPVWVKFPNLPVTLWVDQVLSGICSQLGTPLFAD